ncbi:MAG: hypothetical protein ACI3XQ_01565 [Eubacteriales bacterium]
MKKLLISVVLILTIFALTVPTSADMTTVIGVDFNTMTELKNIVGLSMKPNTSGKANILTATSGLVDDGDVKVLNWNKTKEDAKESILHLSYGLPDCSVLSIKLKYTGEIIGNGMRLGHVMPGLNGDVWHFTYILGTGGELKTDLTLSSGSYNGPTVATLEPDKYYTISSVHDVEKNQIRIYVDYELVHTITEYKDRNQNPITAVAGKGYRFVQNTNDAANLFIRSICVYEGDAPSAEADIACLAAYDETSDVTTTTESDTQTDSATTATNQDTTKATETKAADKTTSADTTTAGEVTENKNESGCKSSTGSVLLSVSLISSAFIFPLICKKKKDRS